MKWQWAFQKHNAHEGGQLCFQKACQRIMLPDKATHNTKKKLDKFLCMRKPQEFLSMEWAIARRELRSLRVGI